MGERGPLSDLLATSARTTLPEEVDEILHQHPAVRLACVVDDLR